MHIPFYYNETGSPAPFPACIYTRVLCTHYSPNTVLSNHLANPTPPLSVGTKPTLNYGNK